MELLFVTDENWRSKILKNRLIIEMETTPFPKDSMVGPPVKLGDDFIVRAPQPFVPGGGCPEPEQHYRIIGEDGDNWLAIRIHG